MNLLFVFWLFRADGALDKLVGLLSEADSELQIESIWCVANITAGENETIRVAKACAPYMITYLSGDNHNVQVSVQSGQVTSQ